MLTVVSPVITLKVRGLPTGNSLPPTPLTLEGSHGRRSLGRLSSLRTYVIFDWVSNNTLPLTLSPPGLTYHRYACNNLNSLVSLYLILDMEDEGVILLLSCLDVVYLCRFPEEDPLLLFALLLTELIIRHLAANDTCWGSWLPVTGHHVCFDDSASCVLGRTLSVPRPYSGGLLPSSADSGEDSAVSCESSLSSSPPVALSTSMGTALLAPLRRAGR